MRVLAAGTGLRQGEVFGLTLDQVDFLRRIFIVDRQLVGIQGQAPKFEPLKSASSVCTVPLPTRGGRADLHRHRGQLLRRSAFGNVWRRAVNDTDIRDCTVPSLRHYDASLLIRHGESVKAVQARLGHASAVGTLDTYSHLWPDAADRPPRPPARTDLPGASPLAGHRVDLSTP